MQVLNYGQSIFEGMKAQHSAKGRIVLFRPDQNANRMHAGAGPESYYSLVVHAYFVVCRFQES